MRFNLYDRRGLVLVIATCLVTLYLGWQQKLDLYIHPRYILFTVIMAALGLVLGSAALFGHLLPPTKKRNQRIATGIVVVLVVAIMVVPKHVPLSSSLAVQRGVNTAAQQSVATILGSDVQSVFNNNDYTQISIREWGGLLKLTDDPTFFKDKIALVTGFITPDPSDAQNRFFVSRFVITCCAVDAQPVGVPVYYPGWQQKYKAEDWVTVHGTFVVTNNKPALKPDEVRVIPEPQEPYVH